MSRICNSWRKQRIRAQWVLGFHHFNTQQGVANWFRRVLLRPLFRFPFSRGAGLRLSKGGKRHRDATKHFPREEIRRLKFQRTCRPVPSSARRHAVRIQHRLHCRQAPSRPGALLSPQSKAHML